jgi:hypothetical protein
MTDAIVVLHLPFDGSLLSTPKIPLDALHSRVDLDGGTDEVESGVGEAEGGMVVYADIVGVRVVSVVVERRLVGRCKGLRQGWTGSGRHRTLNEGEGFAWLLSRNNTRAVLGAAINPW